MTGSIRDPAFSSPLWARPAPRLSDAPSGRMTMLPPAGYQPPVRPFEGDRYRYPAPRPVELSLSPRLSDAPSGRMTMLPPEAWNGK